MSNHLDGALEAIYAGLLEHPGQRSPECAPADAEALDELLDAEALDELLDAEALEELPRCRSPRRTLLG
jgi:hypothetical protein